MRFDVRRIALALSAILLLSACAKQTPGPAPLDLAMQGIQRDRNRCFAGAKSRVDAAVCIANVDQYNLTSAGVDPDIVYLFGEMDAYRIQLYRNGASVDETEFLVQQRGRQIYAQLEAKWAQEAQAQQSAYANSLALLQFGQTLSTPRASAGSPTSTNCRWVGQTWSCTQF